MSRNLLTCLDEGRAGSSHQAHLLAQQCHPRERTVEVEILQATLTPCFVAMVVLLQLELIWPLTRAQQQWRLCVPVACMGAP